MSIPVVDLSAGGEESVKQLLEACKFGAFYVKNHNVPIELCRRLMSELQIFFALPKEDKDAIAFIKSPHWRGYAALGAETTALKTDVREQIEVGLELPAKQADESSPAYERLHGPNQWPSNSLNPAWGSEFKAIVLEYMQHLQQLSDRLLRALGLALQQSEEYLLHYFEQEPHVRMKLVRYPGLSEAAQSLAQAQDLFGVGPHKDYGFFGILLQDNIGGLQYQRNETGEWIDATPIDGTFVVTLGEMIEALTDGHFAATTHRVLVPKGGVARQSINFFFNPRPDAFVKPIELPEQVRSLRPVGEGVQLDGNPNNVILNAYGANALKGMCRSHPDVVERHHPDLTYLTLK
jgi:isopenicillin N synthase-like dioxygenase